MSGRGKGSPRDVEPVGGGEELVGILQVLQKVYKFRELARVFGTDVDSLTGEVLGVADTTDEGVDARVAEAGIDDDGTYQLAGGLQEHQAAVGHVRHVLHRGFVVGVLAHVEEF